MNTEKIKRTDISHIILTHRSSAAPNQSFILVSNAAFSLSYQWEQEDTAMRPMF